MYRISCVHVVPSVKDRLPCSKESAVSLNHRLDDVPVRLARTLVRLDTAEEQSIRVIVVT